MSQWGKDHWSTLAYVEARCVDHKGILSNAQLRVNARLHREFAYVTPFGSAGRGDKYPTLLRDGAKADGHDDVSCIFDMHAEGLLAVRGRYRNGRRTVRFGSREMVVRLTPKGRKIVSALREHKAKGGTFGNFKVEEAVAL